MKFPDIKKFLLTNKQEDLLEHVQDIPSRVSYTFPNTQAGSVYSLLREIPSMKADPVINAALSILMETAFQMGSDQKVFWVVSEIETIKKELEAFHEENNFQQIALDMGYNIALWGNLPYKVCFDDSGRMIGVTPIPDFTRVVPLILSGVLVGFDVDGEIKLPYEYVYAQMDYFKDYGGITQGGIYKGIGSGDDFSDFKNEFVVSSSYLSSAAKPWRNIQIIEDALLLNRMDQSNYYRIISVDVGSSVYSKSAISVLNYYRNLFKKVRRVSYDPSGMVSKGVGQEFEVIVPKNSNQGVDIQSVGGEVDVKALKDLETQYSRLFSALRIQPSMIGFSSDVPSSLGDTPAVLWDIRFAKTCKTIVYSVLRAIKEMDLIYLRSRGFDVKKDDWSYGTLSTSVVEDKDRSDALLSAVDTFSKLTEQFRNNDIEYNQEYLVTSMLGERLSSFGIDVKELLKVEVQGEDKEIISSGVSLLNGFTERETQVLVSNGLLTVEEEKVLLTSGKANKRKYSKTVKKITSGFQCSTDVISFESLSSEDFLYKDSCLVDVSSCVIVTNDIDSNILETKSITSSKKFTYLNIAFPVYVTSDVSIDNITVKDLRWDKYSSLRSVSTRKCDGVPVFSDRGSLLEYLKQSLNGIDSCLVDYLNTVDF